VEKKKLFFIAACLFLVFVEIAVGYIDKPECKDSDKIQAARDKCYMDQLIKLREDCRLQKCPDMTLEECTDCNFSAAYINCRAPDSLCVIAYHVSGNVGRLLMLAPLVIAGIWLFIGFVKMRPRNFWVLIVFSLGLALLRLGVAVKFSDW